MNHDEVKAALTKSYHKVSFWRRALYLGLIATVLLAVLAFSIRLSTGNYLFPALLAGCMFPAAIFVCFSLYKARLWADKAERQSLDISLLDFQH